MNWLSKGWGFSAVDHERWKLMMDVASGAFWHQVI